MLINDNVKYIIKFYFFLRNFLNEPFRVLFYEFEPHLYIYFFENEL
jgi:hypothetical protein